MDNDVTQHTNVDIPKLKDGLEWNDVCRICLINKRERGPHLFSIFEEYTTSNVSLAEVISECSNHKVVRNDKLPQTICDKCKKNAEVAYNFRKLSEKSYTVLFNLLNINDKKKQKDQIFVDLISPSTAKISNKAEIRANELKKILDPKNICHICNIIFQQSGMNRKKYGNQKKISFEENEEEKELDESTNSIRSVKIKNETDLEEFEDITLEPYTLIADSLKNVDDADEDCIPLSEFKDTFKDLINTKAEDIMIKSPTSSATSSSSSSLTSSPKPIKKTTIKFKNPISIPSRKQLVSKSISHPCKYCDKSFYQAELLRKHITSNHPEKAPYYCTICIRGFFKKESLITHNKNIHPERLRTWPIDCAKSEKSVKSEKSIDRNEKSSKRSLCKNRKMKFCQVCKIHIKSTEYDNHLETHANLYTCLECNKKFCRGESLRNHNARNHPEKSAYRCPICVRGFFSKETLDKHNEQDHPNDSEFYCETCGWYFKSKNNLDSHNRRFHFTRTYKKYICEICNRELRNNDVLKIHMKSHGPKQYSCPHCPLISKTRSESQAHSKTHSLQKPHLCIECGRQFAKIQSLKIHMRQHTGETETPYKCKYCGKGSFSRLSDLKAHEKYHIDEKTHVCQTCGKGFHRNYNLVIHMRTHTGERPYSCEYCSKSFTQSNDLKTHVRRHTGERFSCDICSESFIQKYNLTRHKRTVHGINIISRITRLEKFPQLPGNGTTTSGHQ